MTTVDCAPIGHRVEVEGRKLWLHRSGDGGPAVVFSPGAGSFGLDFLLVQDRVAEITSSVLYDRAGTGWSDDIAMPRSADEVTDELRSVLRSVGLPGPYLLVGHSLGGLYVQRYAQRFPDEVAGLLLLDPAHEDWDLYMPEHLQLASQPTGTEMPDLPEEFLVQLRGSFAGMFAGFAEPVRETLIEKHLSPGRLPTGFIEGTNVLALLDELRAGGDRPDVPMIVLSATGVDSGQLMFASEADLREQIAGSTRLYADLAAAAPQGEHRSLSDASHASLPLVRPDAVALAVSDLLGRIRVATPER